MQTDTHDLYMMFDDDSCCDSVLGSLLYYDSSIHLIMMAIQYWRVKDAFDIRLLNVSIPKPSTCIRALLLCDMPRLVCLLRPMLYILSACYSELGEQCKGLSYIRTLCLGWRYYRLRR